VYEKFYRNVLTEESPMLRALVWSFVFLAVSSNAFAVSSGRGGIESTEVRSNEERDPMHASDPSNSAAGRASSIGADADATARRAAQIRANESAQNSRLALVMYNHQDASVRRAAKTMMDLQNNQDVASTQKYRDFRAAIENGADFQAALGEAFGDKGVRSADDFNSACP
jgi:hypothetical protein